MLPGLPDKLYFKIGEVTRIVGVKAHVLRYWETEFPQVRPEKSASGQRVYRRKDVETLLAIKHLLYDKKFTIEGARNHLRDTGVAANVPVDPEAVAEATRQKMQEAMDKEVARTKRSVAEHFHRGLVEIRTRIDELEALLAAPLPGAADSPARDAAPTDE